MNTNLDKPTSRSNGSNAQFLEEGTAFMELTRADEGTGVTTESNPGGAERFDVIVIGGGQAGLSVGYHLARRGVRFVILDERDRVGDVWRQRWDSLRLFTPARFDGLAGMSFPTSGDHFPTKDEMGDYLESYAARFQLPVRTGTRVDALTREGDRYVMRAGGRWFEAPHVVIAMSSYQRPRVPAFALELDPRIVQLHSLDYRRPSQLPPGGVLIVGAANSGAEIAIDLVRAGHPVWVSGMNPGQVPFDIRKPFVHRVVARILFRIVFHRVLTLSTPFGRLARPRFTRKGTPLIRTRERDLAAAGVKRVGRTAGVTGGKPRLDDGTMLDVSGVVWCTGFDIGPSWVRLPVFDEHTEPIQARGVAKGEPGLYFVGAHFLHSVSSAMIHGIARDSGHVAQVIDERLRATVTARG